MTPVELPFDESPPVAGMGTPRIVYLRYRLVPTDEAVEFSAPSLEHETDEWRLYVGALEDTRLPGPVAVASASAGTGDDDATARIRRDIEAIFTFKRRYGSERDAHEAVRPFLEAWELDEGLAEPGRRARFRFEPAGGLAIDLGPPPGEEAKYAVWGGGSFYVRPPGQQVVVDEFRRPPSGFAADEHAITLWRRWERYLKGEDTLAGAGYACLTYIESRIGESHRGAAARLGVSRNVLRKIRQLTSGVGDDGSARKFYPEARRAHTAAEEAFLEAALTALIRRVAEVAAAGDATSLPQIRMSDLPAP